MSTIKVSTIDTPTSSDFAVKTASATRLMILQSGNVGIGTETPTVALNVVGEVNATSFAGNGTIPIGGIIMWSGAIVDIPTGWALCNGQLVNSLHTPNLMDNFIVGAGSGYAVNAKGGNANAIVVSHTHAITDPGHDHNILGRDQTAALGGDPNAELIGGTITNSTAIATAQTGISIVSTGSSGVNANLPPYYALAFIMRIA